MIVADLHGNRLNFEQAAADRRSGRPAAAAPGHAGGLPRRAGVSGRRGGCMSHLLLEDCIRLKTEYPERFHFLLSNHELAELGDFPICKSRRMLNLLFRCGINEMYGAAGAKVRDGLSGIPGELPARRAAGGGVFISHSCPDRCDREPFDVSVLERPLSCGDYESGSPAFKLVWGRDFRAANAEAFARQVGAEVLIHGHEPCEAGYQCAEQAAGDSRRLLLARDLSDLAGGAQADARPDVIGRIRGLHRRIGRQLGRMPPAIHE